MADGVSDLIRRKGVGGSEPLAALGRQRNVMRFTLQNTPVTRLAICLLAGTVIFWTSLGMIGLTQKFMRDGWAEAVSGMIRSIESLTPAQCLRLIGLSTGLCLVACFPVYVTRAPQSFAPLLLSAPLAAALLAGCFVFENWYWFGHLAFPPPALVATTALIALASALTSRAAVMQLDNRESKP